MIAMKGFIGILVLMGLGFIFFCIYYIFKQMQFVIQAINLYKDMVVRQDAMLKILKDIRDGSSKKDYNNIPDVEVTSAYEETQKEIYDKGECPECGDKIDKSAERCFGCDTLLVEYMS